MTSAHRLRHLRAVVGKPPAASSEDARSVMVGNRRRDSAPEIALRRALHGAGMRYRVDLPIRVPGRRAIRPDIVFTRARVAVFVDGCFWHGCPDHGTRPRANSAYWSAKLEINRARDEAQTNALRQGGWTVVRVWEHEPPDTASHRIAALLDAQAARAAGTAVSAERSARATA